MHFLREHFNSKRKKFNNNFLASKAKSFNVLAKTWFIKTNLQYSILVYTFPLYNYFSKHMNQECPV